MDLSDQSVELRSFFPFNYSADDLRNAALSLGKCVKYAAGETLLQSGAPARHCGLILRGQAVAFKIDSEGKRYQLCLEEGCYVGLETMDPEGVYTAKVVALTEIEVLFWNADGIERLTTDYEAFGHGLRMLNSGRTYQEQWLIPETDISDPVLCSVHPHWLSVAAPTFVIIPLLFVCLGVCATLVSRYPAAWLLVLLLLIAGGTLLYKTLTSRMNERVIITSKNIILVPRNNDEEMTVIRISALQSLGVDQNFFERLIDGGRLRLLDSARETRTSLLAGPARIAGLLRSFAQRSAPGRMVPLRVGNEPVRQIPKQEAPKAEPEPVPTPERRTAPLQRDGDVVTPFEPLAFHAHWGLLLKMMFKPLLLTAAALYAVSLLRSSANGGSLVKVLYIAAALGVFVAVYSYFEWRNNRFFIEEDCVRDYNRKPFAGEDVNVAMNNKIQSVRYSKEGFFQVLLNYGTVYILAGEGELTFDYVSDPQHVQQLIMDACARYEAKRRLEEEARRRAYISDLFSEMRAESEAPGTLDNNPNPLVF